MRIDWDLSQRHTLDEVAWTLDGLDEYRYNKQLEPLESVRIALPAGKVLRMDGRASDIILYRRSLGRRPSRRGRARPSPPSRSTASR